VSSSSEHPGIRRGAECLKPLSPDARAYYRNRVAALQEGVDDLDAHLDEIDDGIHALTKSGDPPIGGDRP